MTFEAWKQRVDVAFIEKVGISTDCWPDQCYYDWYEDEVTPMEAVAMAVENEYGYEAACEFGLGEYL